LKSTYFGLQTYEKSRVIMSQAMTLVQNTLFPVVLGFELYPTVLLTERENPQEFFAKGFEVVEDASPQFPVMHMPGQLLIYPLVPLAALKVSQRIYSEVLAAATLSWLDSLNIEINLLSIKVLQGNFREM
jgi:lipoate-protein ligase B